MTIESALNFMGCSILVSIGLAILAGMLILINNLLHLYWKPVKFYSVDYRFVDPPKE